MDERKKITAKTMIGAVILAALLVLLVFIVIRGVKATKSLGEGIESPVATAAPTPTPTPEPTPVPVGLPYFKPHSVDGTEPVRLISKTDIMVDGEIV